MDRYPSPAIPSPALEFCAVISGKEHTPGGAGALSILDEDERATLDDLLRRYGAQGATSELERQARTFLLAYRERERSAGVLEPGERTRLGDILDYQDQPHRDRSHARRARPAFDWRLPRPATIAIAIVVTVLAVVVGVAHNAVSDWFSPPQARPPVTQPIAPVQQHPPVQNPLQQTQALFGPWHTIAPSDQNPYTAQPAVLLLTSAGATQASLRVTVPASASGWQPTDASDVITNLSVNGNHVNITASNGMDYVVGVNQPFWFEDNPSVMFRIDQTGHVYSISVAQATAARRLLTNR